MDEHLRWISANEPCPDGSPSTGYGAGASTTPEASDCRAYTEIQAVDPPATIGYKWTCSAPNGTKKCKMVIKEENDQFDYEGDCGSSDFVITFYDEGRVFACQ